MGKMGLRYQESLTMNIELSPRVFTISMLLILLSSLTFLGGLYYYLNDGKFPWANNSNLLSYTPVTKEPVSFNLDILTPDDNILTTEKSVVISGKSSPGAIVVITNDNQNIGFEVGQNGAFSKVVNLNTGLNVISISAIDPKGNQKTEDRTIYLSEDKI